MNSIAVWLVALITLFVTGCCHQTHTVEVKARTLFQSVELRYSCSFDPVPNN